MGVSVVNALSLELTVEIRRDSQVYRMTYANGDKQTELAVVDTCGKRNTGTHVTFLPDPRISIARSFRSVVCAMS